MMPSSLELRKLSIITSIKRVLSKVKGIRLRFYKYIAVNSFMKGINKKIGEKDENEQMNNSFVDLNLVSEE